MQTLKIWFTDFWPEWKDEDFITPILKKNFEIILDKNHPDIVFHSIFGHTSPNWKCKKILFVAENIRNNYNEEIRKNINIALSSATATIGFDPHTNTNFRLPLWQVYILLKPELKDRLFERRRLENFERFCAFTVSNPSNFIRNGAYSMLSQYKLVHSYGKYMSNDFSLQKSSEGRYWRDAKDEFFLKHSHKFMFAYENTTYRYYCTEKLMDAFLAGSMPIYLGDPRVNEDWNEKAFLNARDLGDNFLNVIKKMDQDTEVFLSKYNEPVFTPEQKRKLEDNLKNFEPWLISIIKK
jgi:alpha(1,3/1,4) fucosyltransferase